MELEFWGLFTEFENLARVVISDHTKIVKPQLK